MIDPRLTQALYNLYPEYTNTNPQLLLDLTRSQLVISTQLNAVTLTRTDTHKQTMITSTDILREHPRTGIQGAQDIRTDGILTAILVDPDIYKPKTQ